MKIVNPQIKKLLDEIGELSTFAGAAAASAAQDIASPVALAAVATPDTVFVSYCWWRAWAGFKRFADSECTDLWAKMLAQGWAWQKTDVVGDIETREGNSSDRVRDRSYHMSEAQVWGFARVLPDGGTVEPGPPRMGDIIFFIELDSSGAPKFKADGTPALRHVGLVKRYLPPQSSP